MTFTEAALEVLRSAGEPLHYKKITEIAITRNLLSHVGRSPEVTMSSRLATLVKKDRGQSVIVKVKPGVFAIREPQMQTDKDSTSPSLETTEGAQAQERTESMPAARPPLPGADVFPAEDDDDAPILGGLEEESEERGRRRRRRRRRGGKGEGSGAEAAGQEQPHEAQRGEQRREGGRDMRHDGRREGRNDQRRDGRRPEHDRDRDRRPRGDEGPPLDLNRQPGDGELLGKDLADAAYLVLTRSDRVPHSFTRVADLLVRRGRLTGAPEALAPTVAAAVRADAVRTQRALLRPRFRLVGQQVSLREWLLPHDAVRSEENVERSADQQRDQVRRAFVSRLNDLPASGFAEIVASWLNCEGVTSLRAVRRPGSSGREFHFAGLLRRGAEETRLAIVVMRSGRDIDRELVVSMRGSLHHYGNATSAWLISTGRIASQAREEAASEGAQPCALFAGADLARAMERYGIGLQLRQVSLCDIDFDLLEALGDPGLHARRERDGDRERDRDRDRDRDRERGRERDRGSRPPARAEDGEEPTAAAAREAADEEQEQSGEAEERESKVTFDLLDPAAAEASRLMSDDTEFSAEDGDEGEELAARSDERDEDAPEDVDGDEPFGEDESSDDEDSEDAPDAEGSDDDQDEGDEENERQASRARES